MLIVILLSLVVAILWSLGEVGYSEISRDLDRANVYVYQYFFRSIIYLLVVVIFQISFFKSFSWNRFLIVLPIILCDFFASYVVNIAMINGKLSVVSPIMAAYPILDILFGIFLLKEKMSLVSLFFVFLVSISIIVLATHTKGDSIAKHPIRGIIFAIIYMIFVALSTYFEKSIYCQNFSIVEFYYYKGIFYFFISIVFASFIGLTPIKFHKLDLKLLQGEALTPIGNILYSLSLNLGNMSVVAPISSLYSVFTVLISRFVLKEKTTVLEKICIGVIAIGTFALILL